MTNENNNNGGAAPAPTPTMLGDIVTADSLEPSPAQTNGYRFAMSRDPATRWAHIDQGRPTWAEVVAYAVSRPSETVYYVQRDGRFNGAYVGYDGMASADPVNKEPYVQDYKLACALFCHLVATKYKPHIALLRQRTSWDILPLTPHDNASNRRNRITLNQYRAMGGLAWQWIGYVKDARPDWQGPQQAVKPMVDALNAEIEHDEFLRHATKSLKHKLFDAKHKLGIVPYIDRSVTPWIPGANMVNAAPTDSAASAQETWLRQFDAAIDYFDENKLSRLPPRRSHDRPVYLPTSVFPPGPDPYGET